MQLYLDVDETILESIESVLRILNKRYNTKFDKSDVTTWNFTNLFPHMTSKEIEDAFDSDKFFNHVRFKLGARELLDKYPNAKFVTKGSSVNLHKKRKLLIQNGYGHMEYIGLEGTTMDKSMVDMSGGIMVDDNQDNLNSCNATYKIMLINNPNSEWNNSFVADDKYTFIAYDCFDVMEIIDSILS